MPYTTRELFARLIQCEAGGEGDDGMGAVASVVGNRSTDVYKRQTCNLSSILSSIRMDKLLIAIMKPLNIFNMCLFYIYSMLQ